MQFLAPKGDSKWVPKGDPMEVRWAGGRKRSGQRSETVGQEAGNIGLEAGNGRVRSRKRRAGGRKRSEAESKQSAFGRQVERGQEAMGRRQETESERPEAGSGQTGSRKRSRRGRKEAKRKPGEGRSGENAVYSRTSMKSGCTSTETAVTLGMRTTTWRLLRPLIFMKTPSTPSRGPPSTLTSVPSRTSSSSGR